MRDDEIRITHIGGPTTLIEVGGWRLLTDPTFDPPGRRYSFGWGTSSRKLTGPALTVDELPPFDAVLLSHDQHGDNLDDLGRSLLAKAPVVITTAPGARRLGGSAVGLRPWETHVLQTQGRPSLEITATPARHGPPLSRAVSGAVIGFALRGFQGDEALWIIGDTVPFRGVREAAERFTVDTLVLHLGGVRFGLTGPIRYSMIGREAVELCELVQPRRIVPVHYEGWRHFHEGRAGVEQAFAAGPAGLRDRVLWLEPGVAETV
jgi:L-ascorbate metabolism protein UlaG (beta-lactamase superfamily)